MKEVYYYRCDNGPTYLGHKYVCSEYSSSVKMSTCYICGGKVRKVPKISKGPSMLPNKISEHITEWYRY